MTRILMIAAAALTTLTGSAALARADDTAAPQATVAYADLNLATDSGVKTLLGRIKTASVGVCAGYDDGGRADLGAVAKAKTCRDAAVTQAVARMNLPALSRMAGGSVVPTTLAAQ